MNIGKWIVVSFVLFAAFIATLVTVCMRQEVSLVSGNYYEEELQFQAQIDRERNANALPTKPSFGLKGRQLELVLNQSMPITEGTLHIFCPSDARMDRRFKVSPDLDTQIFDLEELNSGMYRVKLRWTMNDKEFYREEVIHL